MDIKFKQKQTKEFQQVPLEQATSECVTELLNAAVSFHKLHLKITGQGSFAAHKATNETYDALPEHGDSLAEDFQGAHEKLLTYTEKAPRVLNSVKEGISYANEIKQSITSLQAIMPYSEIVNLLDETKSTINSLKYKLLFLS